MGEARFQCSAVASSGGLQGAAGRGQGGATQGGRKAGRHEEAAEESWGDAAAVITCT